MTSKQEMKAKSRELDEQISVLRKQKNEIEEEIMQISLAEERAEFTCQCVQLNDDIGIYDCGQQARAGRERLGTCVGRVVCLSYSAVTACAHCGGTGKPTSAQMAAAR